MTINPTIEVSITKKKQSDTTDALTQLIQRCMQNDRSAQAELYKQFHGKMLGVCLRYFSNRDDALAALNQGFLKIFKNLQLYNSANDFKGWAYRIVQNTAIDQVRTQIRKDKQMPSSDLVEDLEVSESVIHKLYAKDLLQLMHQLPLTTKVVFNLFAIEGYSHQEIAETLDMSTGTSKWHVNNARTKLKDWITTYE